MREKQLTSKLQHHSQKPPMRRSDWWICLISIGMGSLAALVWWWSRTSLWEDEVIALTHANQPFPLFFVEILRNDIHPPLYFLQLKAWAGLGIDSDTGILLNSVVWAFVSLAVLYKVAKNLYGEKAAWYSCAIYAALPIFAFAAGNLRMYSIVPGLAILTWYANYKWFQGKQNKWLLSAVILEILLAYIHAIEFYFVAFFVLAALSESLWSGQHRNAGDSQRALIKWLLWQLIAGLCMLPLVASGLVRGSDAGAPGNIWQVLSEPGSLVAGWGPSSIVWLRITGLVIFSFLAVVAIKLPATRVRTLIIPIGALFVAILVSVFLKPMLKTPVFASNLLPFLALGAGAGLAGLSAKWVRTGTVICLGLLSAAAIPLVYLQLPKDSFAGSAAYLKQNAKAGDIIVVPNVSVFWGILRYAVGPHWGRPLEVMPLQPNAQWSALLKKMGPAYSTALGLHPKTDIVVKDGITYVIGQDAIQTTKAANRVWVVQRDGYVVDAELGGLFSRKSMVRVASGDVVLSLFEKDPGGKNVAEHPLKMKDAKIESY
jgi:mannosyltransferase